MRIWQLSTHGSRRSRHAPHLLVSTANRYATGRLSLCSIGRRDRLEVVEVDCQAAVVGLTIRYLYIFMYISDREAPHESRFLHRASRASRRVYGQGVRQPCSPPHHPSECPHSRNDL